MTGRLIASEVKVSSVRSFMPGTSCFVAANSGGMKTKSNCPDFAAASVASSSTLRIVTRLKGDFLP